jgi:hypothetical protein
MKFISNSHVWKYVRVYIILPYRAQKTYSIHAEWKEIGFDLFPMKTKQRFVMLGIKSVVRQTFPLARCGWLDAYEISMMHTQSNITDIIFTWVHNTANQSRSQIMPVRGLC